MSIHRITNAFLLSIFFIFTVTLSQQDKDKKFILTIGGEVPNPIQFTMEDIKLLPHQTVHGVDRAGKDFTYQGVSLLDLLQKVGTPLGKNLRGKELSKVMRVDAANDYHVLYALPEIDTEFTNNNVIIADTKDNLPLDGKDGPLQLINPVDKHHARWVRQVQAITIQKIPDVTIPPIK